MKPVTKVFLVIGTLVLSLLVWGLFFNKGGVIQQGWDAVVSPVNSAWQKITGSNTDLIPKFDASSASGSYDGNATLQDLTK